MNGLSRSPGEKVMPDANVVLANVPLIVGRITGLATGGEDRSPGGYTRAQNLDVERDIGERWLLYLNINSARPIAARDQIVTAKIFRSGRRGQQSEIHSGAVERRWCDALHGQHTLKAVRKAGPNTRGKHVQAQEDSHGETAGGSGNRSR